MGAGYFFHLYVVRHGLTLWNKEKRYLGHTDQPCLERGFREFRKLRSAFSSIPFDRVYSSDLQRCQQTVQYIFPNLTNLSISAGLSHPEPDHSGKQVHPSLLLDPRLRELHFGKWEGKTYEDLREDTHYLRWLEDWENHAPPQGETGRQFQHRIRTFIEDMFKHVLEKEEKNTREDIDTQHILIVTHAGVIRYMLTYFQPERTYWEWSVKQGGAYRLTLSRGKGEWECCSLREVPTPESAGS